MTLRHKNDVTFESQGAMGVFFRNLTDGVVRARLDDPVEMSACAWLAPAQATLSYTPATPAWTRNVDWKVIPQAQYRLLPAHTTVPRRGGYGPFGTALAMTVTDRSANKVARNGRYVFDQPVVLINTTIISIHFWVEGADGGSIVKPFIGHFNPSANPQWTYEPVPDFNGLFMRTFASPDFLDGFTLTISYEPYGPLGQTPSGSMSRLVYSVSGSYSSFAQWTIAPWNVNGDPGGRFDS